LTATFDSHRRFEPISVLNSFIFQRDNTSVVPSIRESMTDWFERSIAPWARTPLYAAIVSLVGLIAGLLAAIYGDEIKMAFPLVVGYGPVSWHAVYFWSTAILATAMFFFAQRASESERAKSEARLIQRSSELSKLIRTLPPADFLARFRQIFSDCSVAFAGILDAKPPDLNAEIVKKAIRIVLYGAAMLAREFDGAPDGILYAANIMLFRPSSQLTAEEIASLKPDLRFSPPETDLRALKGLLVLQLELSTIARGGLSLEAQEPDSDLAPLALAVPTTQTDPNSRRWRVLPGAPMAFCSGDLAAYTDTLTLGKWCRKEGDFPPSTAAEVDAYFGSERARRIRSFISIPLKSLGAQIGVLNIHRSEVGLLAEKAPVQQFVPLIAPLNFVLVRLLDVLQQLDQ
jgi:hypothetical protein